MRGIAVVQQVKAIPPHRYCVYGCFIGYSWCLLVLCRIDITLVIWGCGLGGVAVGVGFVPLPGGMDDGFNVGEGWLPAEGGAGAGGVGD